MLCLADQYGGEGCVSHKAEATHQWHHVVAIWNGIEQKIYVDAQLKSTEHTLNFILNTTSVSAEPARLGTQAKSALRENRYFRGLIDEVAVFARALSDEEIQTLYQTGLAGETLAKPGRTGRTR